MFYHPVDLLLEASWFAVILSFALMRVHGALDRSHRRCSSLRFSLLSSLLLLLLLLLLLARSFWCPSLLRYLGRLNGEVSGSLREYIKSQHLFLANILSTEYEDDSEISSCCILTRIRSVIRQNLEWEIGRFPKDEKSRINTWQVFTHDGKYLLIRPCMISIR